MDRVDIKNMRLYIWGKNKQWLALQGVFQFKRIIVQFFPSDAD